MSTYRVTLPFETFLIRANFAQASSPITANFDPDEDEDSWSSTPYQAADARHNPESAARMVVEYCGRDYYAAPNDDRDDQTILDEIEIRVGALG